MFSKIGLALFRGLAAILEFCFSHQVAPFYISIILIFQVNINRISRNLIKSLDKSSQLIYNNIKPLDIGGKNDMKEQLRALREAASLTQKEAAAKLGVVQPAVSMWETGESKPKTEILPKIAAVYGCSISELFASA